MKRISSILKFLLQFFPLTVFLKVAFHSGAPQAGDWLNAFMWAGAAAILQLVLLLFFTRGEPLNRLVVSINVYFILGGIAVLTNQIGFLEILNKLKESGIFLCMLVVGIVTTFASKAGFVGIVDFSRQGDIRHYSLVLIMLTAVGLVLSFWFRGHILLSSCPLIVIGLTNQFFKRQLQRSQSGSLP
ncbi:hypothetical protein [Thiolinea disciformis]|uniref:hypothetical protein n=1 Tax=Thiolinea disciformis TaxID=125614 RepID=UPI000369BFA7|nr:hypothetical protein [Thiolinea disciformis]